jgi:hypothetical protein
MDVETSYGLTTGLISAGEALQTDWRSRRDELDLVRVVDPEASSWPALQRAGFGLHPAWITWISGVQESEEAFLAGLSVKGRRSVRVAQRLVADAGIQMKVAMPLAADAFDAFLELYDRQIGTMRHGVPFARQERAELLEQGDHYFAVQALAGDALLGSCVCRKREDVSTVVIRFTTTAPDSRSQQIVRAMYMHVFQAARELGWPHISLGTDPALYGHIAKPGLFSFKSSLRFAPTPARLFGSMLDPDEATLVLRLDTLTDPSLLLCYQLPEHGATDPVTADTPLRLEVVTGHQEVDLSPYRAPFLAGVAVRRIA